MKPGSSGSGAAQGGLLGSQPGTAQAGPPPQPPAASSGLGIRGRLFVVLVVLVIAVELVSGAYLATQLHAWGQTRAEAELLAHARAVAGTLAEGTGDPDAVADRVSAEIGARVTVLAADGAVLGDSEFAPAQLAGLGSHADRPEVLAAARSGQGTARRGSSSLATEMLYVAVPRRGGGTVRVARSLEAVEAMVRTLWIAFGVAAGLGLLGAVLLTGLASQYLARPLQRLVEDTRRHVAPTPAPETAGSLHKMAEELEAAVGTLASERGRFEAVLESMDEGVIALDQNQQLTMINRAAVGLLSLSIEHDGATLAERIPIPALHELVTQALAGQPERREFATLTTPPRQIQAYASPLRNQQGAVVVMHDVTEIRRLERVRRDFVANVSHELRTPVSVIRLNAETLLDGALEKPEVARKFLEAQMRNADRLSALVSDLLEISRIEAGTYAVHSDVVAVLPVLERTIDSVERLAQEKNLTIVCDAPANLAVWADAHALEQVLVNLVDNAVKYTPGGGRIRVGARAEGERVCITVEDNGPGIEPRHRARVFERFYRVDKGRSREVGGTGLGLAIVKHLAEAMDGSVGVEPASPQGSIFWVRLAAAQE
ncbi:MAG: PAS domain-containing protein [Myxococcales bacterium]|nr:PAS domain-containing protein [Myxococcales bacterium]